ncbi:MAG: hypothetical protein SAL07_19665 [Oscillatoria sp. PMC 1051.18]|nr:hypothetical protein [Oscillatoria sp. PMC 1050.18]MEC5032121.1 hypothetical protein [Oscillatoria sp. PMC 1051.18]
MPNNYPYQSGILPLRERIIIATINQSSELINRLEDKQQTATNKENKK